MQIFEERRQFFRKTGSQLPPSAPTSAIPFKGVPYKLVLSVDYFNLPINVLDLHTLSKYFALS